MSALEVKTSSSKLCYVFATISFLFIEMVSVCWDPLLLKNQHMTASLENRILNHTVLSKTFD